MFFHLLYLTIALEYQPRPFIEPQISIIFATVVLTMLDFKLGINALVFCVFLLLFVLQTKEIITKFFEGHTTIATDIQKYDHQYPPIIAICPGYKHDFVQDFIDRSMDPWPFPTLFDTHPDSSGSSKM